MAIHTKLNFPLDDQHWMVVWVDRVALVEDDYLFEVHLSSIDIQKFNQVFYKSDSYTRKYVICRTSTEQFSRQAEIGSIWHRQQLIFSPSQHHTAYPGLATHTITLHRPALAINQPLGEMVHRTKNIAGFHPFNAPRYSPLPPQLGQSPCLLIDSPHFTITGRPRTAFLIFPPSELFRFYHCGSSPYLFRQILGNGLVEDRIYKRRATRYNDTTQQLFVQLRKQVPDEDALLVGRLAGDRVAYAAARDIGRHLQQSFIHADTAHLATSFPFGSPTTLQVVGKLLRTWDKDNEWAFFVYAIISCSSAFPFRHLLYSRDNDNTVRTAGSSSDAPHTRRGIGILSEGGAPTNSAAAISTGQAGGQRPAASATPVLKFTLAPSFSRLPKDQRPVTVPGKVPSWYNRPERVSILPAPPIIPGEVMNPPVPPLDSTQENPPSLSYDEFRSIMTGLTQLGLTCYCLTYWSGWAQSKYYKDFYLPRYRTLDTKERKWLNVVIGLVADIRTPGRIRKLRKRRKAVVLEILYGYDKFYLIECEAGITESFSRMLIWYDHAVNLSDELNQVFLTLVLKKGIWREFPFSSYATTRPLHHVSGETGLSVARRVFSYIKQIINRYSANSGTLSPLSAIS